MADKPLAATGKEEPAREARAEEYPDSTLKRIASGEQARRAQDEPVYDYDYIMTSDPSGYGARPEELIGALKLVEVETGKPVEGLTKTELLEALEHFRTREV